MVHISMLRWHFVITETWDGSLNMDYLGTRLESGVGELVTVHLSQLLREQVYVCWGWAHSSFEDKSTLIKRVCFEEHRTSWGRSFLRILHFWWKSIFLKYGMTGRQDLNSWEGLSPTLHRSCFPRSGRAASGFAVQQCHSLTARHGQPAGDKTRFNLLLFLA